MFSLSRQDLKRNADKGAFGLNYRKPLPSFVVKFWLPDSWPTFGSPASFGMHEDSASLPLGDAGEELEEAFDQLSCASL